MRRLYFFNCLFTLLLLSLSTFDVLRNNNHMGKGNNTAKIRIGEINTPESAHPNKNAHQSRLRNGLKNNILVYSVEFVVDYFCCN